MDANTSFDEDEPQEKMTPEEEKRMMAKARAFWRAEEKEPWNAANPCLWCDGIPCWQVFDDPRILADPSLQPDHISGRMLRVSTKYWVRDHVSERYSLSLELTFPLPVGKQSLAAHLKDRSHGEKRRLPLRGSSRPVSDELTDDDLRTFGGPYRFAFKGEVYDALTPLMPFEGDEHAALILTATFPRASVTLFGLAEPIGERDEYGDVEAAQFVNCRFVASGTHPDDADAARWMKATRRWWTTRVQGERVRGSANAGRPTLKIPQRELFEEIKRYLHIVRSGGKTASVSGLAKHLGHDKEAVAGLLERRNIPFPPL